MSLNPEHEHVHPDSWHRLLHSDEERIDYMLGDQWVAYPVAAALLSELDDTVTAPDRLSPKGKVLVAESQMGKSAIISEFHRRYPASDNTEGEFAKVPVLRIQFPDSGGEAVYGEICRALNVVLPGRPTPLQLRSEALQAMDDAGVRVLVIDELANVLTGRAPAKQKSLNQIKFIMNERRRPIVLGATKEAYSLICQDPQITRRFKKLVIPKLTLASLAFLVHGWVHQQPLKRPSVLDEGVLKKLHNGCVGHTGTLIDFLQQMAKYAVQTKVERIDMNVVSAVIDGAAR